MNDSGPAQPDCIQPQLPHHHCGGQQGFHSGQLMEIFLLDIDRHLALLFYYFFLYLYLSVYVSVCKFSPQESQSDVLGDLLRMISLVVGSYFGLLCSCRDLNLHPLECRLC
jgi:hypothetical protein